jgi:hypothetical protein
MFQGQPIAARPGIQRRERLRSLGVSVLVALRLAPLALFLFSPEPAIAVVVGAAIAGRSCVLLADGRIDRGAVVMWGFAAAAATAFVDMTLRSINFAALLWIPACLSGCVVALVQRRLWRPSVVSDS